MSSATGLRRIPRLKAVADHQRPASGLVKIDDDVVVARPGSGRGMVFQQYSLLRWQTSRERVALGPWLAGHGDPDQIASPFLDIVGLSRFADRYPEGLSGGMRQRVGLVLTTYYPLVVLMDLPFGALDTQTRLVKQENLLEIWRRFSTPVVFVTRDVGEAISWPTASWW